MANFEGTIQEFHHFLGPRIRNAVNNFTRTHRNQRDGICENCGEKKELHSAHIHGQDRRTIIQNILSSHMNNGQVKCNIGEIEKEILTAHLPIENCFKFLCHVCHVAYDSNNNFQTPQRASVSNNNSPEKFKKINRIKLWANRSSQDNHKIIMAYLHLEKNGAVSFSELKTLCSTRPNNPYYVEKFDGHYASMKTDKGNSHGTVFYDENGFVYIWPKVREEIKNHFENNG